jgi:hypothetical protein
VRCHKQDNCTPKRTCFKIVFQCLLKEASDYGSSGSKHVALCVMTAQCCVGRHNFRLFVTQKKKHNEMYQYKRKAKIFLTSVRNVIYSWLKKTRDFWFSEPNSAEQRDDWHPCICYAMQGSLISQWMSLCCTEFHRCRCVSEPSASLTCFH